jgi:hypothetical protein
MNNFPDPARLIGGEHTGYTLNRSTVNHCGHPYVEALLIAGCTNGCIDEWVACNQCQLETLDAMREGERVYLACGHVCLDLIYQYLTVATIYPSLHDAIFDYKGLLIQKASS